MDNPTGIEMAILALGIAASAYAFWRRFGTVIALIQSAKKDQNFRLGDFARRARIFFWEVLFQAKVIQQRGAIRVLGSFPRVNMRTKYVKSFGFIGTGAMSKWFAKRLESEGYEVLLTGRSTTLRPEQMIARVDVVVV